MPSKANLRQHGVCAIALGLTNVIGEELYPGDEIFREYHQRIDKSAIAVFKALDADPGGTLGGKNINRLKRSFELLEVAHYIGRPTDAMHPLSMCICLISDQLSFMKHGIKRNAFEKLLDEMENLCWLLDPDGEYSAPDGFDAANFYAQLEI